MNGNLPSEPHAPEDARRAAGGPSSPQACDLLIRNGYVITLDGRRRIFRTGAVAVEGRQITAVGPDRDVAPRFRPKRVIDAGGAPVHPGFFDCHVHMTLHSTRGAFVDTPDKGEYFNSYVRWMNALGDDDEHASALLACLEMLRNGITCFLEPGTAFQPDAVAEAAERIGMRGSVADPFLWDIANGHNVMASSMERAPAKRERAFRLLGGQLRRNQSPDALVRGHVALYGEGSASDELALAAKACADEHHVVLTQHQSFEVDDTEVDDARFGRHVLLHYAENGTLGPNCTFAHMNVIRDDEVNAIVESGLSIAWNPGNYMNYGIGSTVRTRVSELYRRGVSITPVSDVAKVWGFGEQGFVGYLVAREKQGYLSPEDLMEMATVCGAKAMGLADRVGSLEPGKDADIVIRTDALPEAHPETNPIRNLVLVSRSKSVDTVIVNGRPVVEHGRTTLVSEEDVYALVRASVQRMTSRLGLRTGTSWPEE